MLACNSILALIEKEYYAPGLQVGISKKGKETQLNGLFVARGLRRMLQGKNYKNVSMVFQLLAGFLEQCTGWMKEAPETKVHLLCFKLMLSTTTNNSRKRLE